MKNKHTADLVAKVLLIIGGLDLGFAGLFKWDFISAIFGDMTGFTRVVFFVIGVAALWKIFRWVRQQQKR